MNKFSRVITKCHSNCFTACSITGSFLLCSPNEIVPRHFSSGLKFNLHETNTLQAKLKVNDSRKLFCHRYFQNHSALSFGCRHFFFGDWAKCLGCFISQQRPQLSLLIDAGFVVWKHALQSFSLNYLTYLGSSPGVGYRGICNDCITAVHPVYFFIILLNNNYFLMFYRENNDFVCLNTVRYIFYLKQPLFNCGILLYLYFYYFVFLDSISYSFLRVFCNVCLCSNTSDTLNTPNFVHSRHYTGYVVMY